MTTPDNVARWWAPDLDPLLAVATATLDDSGALIAANAGFLRLVDPQRAGQTGQTAAIPRFLASNSPARVGDNVARFFIQPTFEDLVTSPVGENGKAHEGLLTIGDYLGVTQTLRSRITRVGDHLRVLAEHDVEELERMTTVVLDLNREYANAQLELAQTNLKLHQREAQILESAMTDPLTGVGNRRRLEQALALEIERAEQTGEPLAAFMADLDHFKRVNDEYGHQAGDKVLAAFGQLLREHTRTTDILARFGGEEFVALLPHTGLAQAVAIAERTRKAVERLEIEPVPHPVTGSFGVAVLAPGERGEGLIRRLDALLYAAKNAGRNRVVAA